MNKWIYLLICPLLAIAFLPQIASSRWGKPFFIKAIEKKTGAHVELESLHFSWTGPQTFQNVRWEKENVTGSIDRFQIHAPFWSFSGPFELKNGSLKAQGTSVEKIEGHIVGNDFDLTATTFQGHIALKGKIESKHQFNFQIDIKNLPLNILGHELDLWLGKTVDLNGQIQMNQSVGELHLNVRSSYLQTMINAYLNEEVLTLKEPMKLTLKSPLFDLATLSIDPKGFSFPLPYSLENIKMANAQLNLGKVRAKNDPLFNALFSLLNAQAGLNGKSIMIWFAPTTVSLNESNLTYTRLEALIENSIHLCSWGDINLTNEKLNLYLGLPANTLRKSFGIKNLNPDYVMKVKVDGTIKKPEIAKNQVATKIAALMAAGQVPKKGILGGLAEIITSPKIDKDVPPAKHPFPWEK